MEFLNSDPDIRIDRNATGIVIRLGASIQDARETEILQISALNRHRLRRLHKSVAAFEQLRGSGKIRTWGVSNFDAGQMEELFRVPNGHRCATNQVPYSLNNRRIERDVLPWCAKHIVPVMAYSPLGGDKNLLVGDRTLAQIGAAHGCSAAAVALAWVIRSGKVIAIPESGSPVHAKENAVALSIALTPQDIQTLDAVYPGPVGAA